MAGKVKKILCCVGMLSWEKGQEIRWSYFVDYLMSVRCCVIFKKVLRIEDFQAMCQHGRSVFMLVCG